MVALKDIINLSKITGAKVAVGVSGGADSLALVLLLDELLRPQGRQVIALTVDHGLREESATEAAYVAKLMAEHEIEHHILEWQGEKPSTGIEEAARDVRYALLKGWCQANGVEILCVAHHQQDQAETFLMRLQRGSGVTGLCGMAEVNELDGVSIVRPLLNISSECLKSYLQQRNISWVEDPSNQSEDFLRCRVRKLLPVMEDMVGISSKRIADTMRVLSRTKDYVAQQRDNFIQANVTWWEDVAVCLPVKALQNEHEEIVYQVIRALIRKVGGNQYTARSDDVERLIGRMFGDFRGATLGHCEIFICRGKIWIIPELKLKAQLPKKIWKNFTDCFPAYQRVDLPYKLRAVLVKTKMSIEF